ncbi:type VII secretion protein EccB [Pseudonocardia dioxanivorans]|uniref:type VII secretion protein EccB n=1 Tax=Pseudonocardia dioxanivorans TaxID=240495 RepID=UPI000CD31928|nr:type VII secretion protein EccB [Pseudonocardia dioxanivorans]
MVRPATIRNPATRDQADAYRFGLRRMEAALVRGDTVLQHEQLRSQRRAAFAGVVLALLALGGVALHAAIAPAPDWTRQHLVVTREGGTLYAVAHGPDRLIPVTGTAAGRLVLAALGDTAAATAVPVTVDDDDLAGAPRTPIAEAPAAVGVRPEGPGPVGAWAVCDRVTPDGSELTGTTVVAGGAAAPGDPAAVLVRGGGATYAIVDGVRYGIDLDDAPLLAGLGADAGTVRPISPGLLSVVPDGGRLATPSLPRGRPPTGVDALVGDVVSTVEERSYVVLPTGLREVPPLLAKVLAARSGRPVGTVAPTTVAALRVSTPPLGEWPAPPARWAERSPVVCRTWTPNGARVGVGDALPVPSGAVTVDLAQRDGPGPRTDAVVLGEGAGGPVRTGTGPALVSTTGVVHHVADDATAAALGLGAAEPAPDAVLALLPTGATLDLGATDRVVDVPAAGN